MRLIRSVRPSSCRTNGIARPSAAIVAVRSAGWPMTLTQTLAWRRSGVVSTRVIVANPMRGSATSRVTIAPISCRSSSIDPIGALAHVRPSSSRAADAPADRLRREALDDVALLEVV